MRTFLAICLSVAIWVLFTRIGGYLLVQLELLRSDYTRDFIEFAVAVGCSIFGVYLAKLAAETWIKSYRRRLVAVPFGFIVLVNLYLEFVVGWGPSSPITTSLASLGVLGAAYLLFWKHEDVETVAISEEQIQDQTEFKNQIAELDQTEHYINEKIATIGDDDFDTDIDDEDFLEDNPVGLSPKEQVAYDLAKELEDWPDDKAKLAHRFFKCFVLGESEEDGNTMAQQFTPDQFKFLLDLGERYIIEEIAAIDGDDDFDADIDDEDFLEDDPVGLSPKEQVAYDLAKELEDWPDDKAELAHRFIKCVVLRESEEEANTMARQFTPDQFKFLYAHITDVLRLYGNNEEAYKE